MITHLELRVVSFHGSVGNEKSNQGDEEGGDGASYGHTVCQIKSPKIIDERANLELRLVDDPLTIILIARNGNVISTARGEHVLCTIELGTFHAFHAGTTFARQTERGRCVVSRTLSQVEVGGESRSKRSWDLRNPLALDSDSAIFVMLVEVTVMRGRHIWLHNMGSCR